MLFDEFLPNVQLKDNLASTTVIICADIIHLSHIVALKDYTDTKGKNSVSPNLELKK